LHFSLDINKIT